MGVEPELVYTTLQRIPGDALEQEHSLLNAGLLSACRSAGTDGSLLMASEGPDTRSVNNPFTGRSLLSRFGGEHNMASQRQFSKRSLGFP